METMLIKNKCGREVLVEKSHGINLITKEGASLIMPSTVKVVETPKVEVTSNIDKTVIRVEDDLNELTKSKLISMLVERELPYEKTMNKTQLINLLK